MTLVVGNRSLCYCNFHGATMTTGGVSGGYYDVTLVAGNRSLYYCNFHGATMTTGGVSGGIMMWHLLLVTDHCIIVTSMVLLWQ